MNLNESTNAFYDSMIGVLSPNTIKWYQNRLPSLAQALGDVDISQVTPIQLNFWRSTLCNRTARYESHPYQHEKEGGLSPYTIHTYVRAVKRLFNWMHQEKLINANPAEHLALPKLPDYKPRGISTHNRDRIIDAVIDCPRDYAIVMFLSDTACRVGGLSWLKMDDLTLEENRATVREKGRGGNQKERTVFYGQETQIALIHWLETRPQVSKCPYVFVGCHHGDWGRLQEVGIYQVLKRAAIRAGVDDSYNPHSFRHGAIRGLLANGMSLPEVAQIAGHSSVSVTGDIYGKFDENHLAARHAKFSWIKTHA